MHAKASGAALYTLLRSIPPSLENFLLMRVKGKSSQILFRELQISDPQTLFIKLTDHLVNQTATKYQHKGKTAKPNQPSKPNSKRKANPTGLPTQRNAGHRRRPAHFARQPSAEARGRHLCPRPCRLAGRCRRAPANQP